MPEERVPQHQEPESAAFCIDCGECVSVCLLLQTAGRSPSEMLSSGRLTGEAFRCTLCGACGAVCPVGIHPEFMMHEERVRAGASGEMDLAPYEYLMPDRPLNVMSAYRQAADVDFSDLEPTGIAEVCFFPGCTLLTYAPTLVRAIHARLVKNGETCGILTDCCAKPLFQIGHMPRWRETKRRLIEKLKAHGVQKLVIGCSGCFYELRQDVEDSGITAQTVYEVLGEDVCKGNAGVQCTVHDTCPDRSEGLWAKQVRHGLTTAGYAIVEMSRNHARTVCCGSGGLVSHFDPELADYATLQRCEEASATGAEVLVAYCMACVQRLQRFSSEIPVKHALEILLDHEVDHIATRERMNQILSGPGSEELWVRILGEGDAENSHVPER